MGSATTQMILRAWWDRLRGRLVPGPFPFSEARILDLPMRARVASPERILTAFGLAAGEQVLEIGPGNGYYSIEAARRVEPRGRLICLDIQSEMLLAARRRTRENGLDRVAYVQGGASALPFRSGSIDHLFLITVLGEIPDRPRALSEFARVLRPRGRLSISEQFPDPDFMPRASLRRILAAAGFVEVATRGRLWLTSTWKLDAGR